MHKDSIFKFLQHVNSKVAQVQERAGWVVGSCPFAAWRHDGGVDKHPSFAVRIKEGNQSMYNCFSCNSHGDLSDMILDLRQLKATNIEWEAALQLIAQEEDEFDMVIKDYQEVIEDSDTVKTFPEWWLDSFPLAKDHEEALEYLYSRELDTKIINELPIVYDTVRKRVCFPIRDWNGFLVGLHGRTIVDDKQTYHMYGCNGVRNKLPWLGESWVDLDQPVLLVESVFDLASAYRVTPNVMCSLSAGISKAKAKRIVDAADIVTLYDYGKGGDAARTALSKYLPKSHIIHQIPTEEEGDPGNMSIEQLMAYLTTD